MMICHKVNMSMCQQVMFLEYIGVQYDIANLFVFNHGFFQTHQTHFTRSSVRRSFWEVFIVAEHLFCTYFLVEWCVRFGAFENKRHLGAIFSKSSVPFIFSSLGPDISLDISGDCLRDFWLLFDGLLMFVTVFELGTSGWFMCCSLTGKTVDGEISGW